MIAQNDSYSFLSNRKNKQSKLISSLRLYPGIFKIVYTANRKAIKGIYNSEAWIKSSVDILHLFEKIGTDVYIDGMNNFKNYDKPVIFISNHMSTLETLLFSGVIHPVKKICFIMKKELIDFPLFGPVSGARHPIVVGRVNPREDLLQVFTEGEKRINDGLSIVVFPQKSRNSILVESQFNTIGLKIAQKNNVPIIPIAVKTDVWTNGKLVRDFGMIDTNNDIHISFGEIIKPEEINKDTNQKIIEFIKNKLTEWDKK
jgi:1-acyl-sn-glycerol-3-phosphate acyltransferase